MLDTQRNECNFAWAPSRGTNCNIPPNAHVRKNRLVNYSLMLLLLNYIIIFLDKMLMVIRCVFCLFHLKAIFYIMTETNNVLVMTSSSIYALL